MLHAPGNVSRVVEISCRESILKIIHDKRTLIIISSLFAKEYKIGNIHILLRSYPYFEATFHDLAYHRKTENQVLSILNSLDLRVEDSLF